MVKTRGAAKATGGARGAETHRFILLPPRGLRPQTEAAIQAVGAFFQRAAAALAAGGPRTLAVEDAPKAKMRVLDSIRDDGAKLVEMTLPTMLALRAAQPGLRIVPEIFYRPALYRPTVAAPPKAAAAAVRAAPKITLSVVAKGSSRPIAGAMVVAFVDFEGRIGAQGVTNAAGKVALNLRAVSKRLERLYVYPGARFWPTLQQNITVRTGMTIPLDPIDLSFIDSVRFFYGNAADGVGAGVMVGVVDSGVDLHHPDLNVQGGLNTVEGEDPKDFGDGGGEHHGSHVAGIIAARGFPPSGVRGIAPGVTLRSYRVFGRGGEGASNFAIAKAIDAAIADGCDLLNLSLGEPAPTPGSPLAPDDDVLSSAIADARAAGALVLAAAGNDDRGPVSFPACDPRALAVAAMGRLGTFPAGSEPEGSVMAPFGKDKQNFLASFSNIGPELDLIGPGVGIISTVPGGYAIMSGTSMACPAVTGAAARLLSANAAILALPRNQSRSDAMAKLLLQAAKPLGFGPIYEGQGLPR